MVVHSRPCEAWLVSSRGPVCHRPWCSNSSPKWVVLTLPSPLCCIYLVASINSPQSVVPNCRDITDALTVWWVCCFDDTTHLVGFVLCSCCCDITHMGSVSSVALLSCSRVFFFFFFFLFFFCACSSWHHLLLKIWRLCLFYLIQSVFAQPFYLTQSVCLHSHGYIPTRGSVLYTVWWHHLHCRIFWLLLVAVTNDITHTMRKNFFCTQLSWHHP